MTDNIETKVSMEGGLSLRKEEKSAVTGGKDIKYFANLHFGIIGTENERPQGVRADIKDLEIEITEAIYEHLLKQRGNGTAYGKITIEPYVRTQEPESEE